MKYVRLVIKYAGLFIGAVLFGLAAVKLSSANKREREQGQKVRDMTEGEIDASTNQIEKHVYKLADKQVKAKRAKENALTKLDKISDKSNSVKSLLDEYNRDRMQSDSDSNFV